MVVNVYTLQPIATCFNLRHLRAFSSIRVSAVLCGLVGRDSVELSSYGFSDHRSDRISYRPMSAGLFRLSAGEDLHLTVREHYRHDVISSMLLRNYRLIRGFEPLPHE